MQEKSTRMGTIFDLKPASPVCRADCRDKRGEPKSVHGLNSRLRRTCERTVLVCIECIVFRRLFSLRGIF